MTGNGAEALPRRQPRPGPERGLNRARALPKASALPRRQSARPHRGPGPSQGRIPAAGSLRCLEEVAGPCLGRSLWG